jgi:hypothetical protein
MRRLMEQSPPKPPHETLHGESTHCSCPVGRLLCLGISRLWLVQPVFLYGKKFLEALTTLDWSRHERLVVDDDDPRRMCRIPTKGDPRHGSVCFAKARRACASLMDSGKKRLIDLYSNLRGVERRCGSLRSGWQTGSVFSFSLNPSSTAPSLMRLRPGLRQIISLHEFHQVLVESLPTGQVCGRVTLLLRQVPVTSRFDKTCQT